MTPLRRRMIEDMQLRGLSPLTQRAYLQAVKQFALYYGKSPEQITDEQLRAYFLYLYNEKHIARSTATVVCCPHKTRQLGMIESSIKRAEHEGKSLHRRPDYQDFGTGRTWRTECWCCVSRTRRCRGDILPLAQDVCWDERR